MPEHSCHPFHGGSHHPGCVVFTDLEANIVLVPGWACGLAGESETTIYAYLALLVLLAKQVIL